MKTIKIALIALSMTLTAGQAISAAVYTLDDNWINGPSFSSTHGGEIGTPNVHNMLGTVENNPSDINSHSLVRSNVDYSISGLSQGADSLWHLTYSLSDGLPLSGGFFIAYAPWCANDAIRGGHGVATNTAPVPEPATLLLFGAGLAGLAGFARQWRKE